MIEITYTEILLFIWGALATGYALKYKLKQTEISKLFQHAVENPALYQHIHESWKEARSEA